MKIYVIPYVVNHSGQKLPQKLSTYHISQTADLTQCIFHSEHQDVKRSLSKTFSKLEYNACCIYKINKISKESYFENNP